MRNQIVVVTALELQDTGTVIRRRRAMSSVQRIYNIFGIWRYLQRTLTCISKMPYSFFTSSSDLFSSYFLPLPRVDQEGGD